VPTQDNFLIGAAVGSGLAASAAERGGADFLLAINAGRMRNMGSPSAAGILPIADATQSTMSFSKDEVLSRSFIPVLVGVNVMGYSNDPVQIIDDVVQQGFDGVVNFPSAIHYPSSMQHILERGNRGVGREVEVLKEAKSRGLKTLFYCANRTQARLGADACLDMILLNFGWNAGGAFGHTASTSLEEVAFKTLEIGRFVKRINPDTRFLLEGGPIVTSQDLERVVELADVDGYVGGSTIERLPMENAVGNLIAAYRQAGNRKTNFSTSEQNLLRWGHDIGAAGKSSELMKCLLTLKRLAPLKNPVFLQHYPGADVIWVLRALEHLAENINVQVLRPGLEDKHGASGRRLFGEQRDGVYKQGALCDKECATIIVHAPERLSPRTQRRLARAITEERYMAIGSRRWRPVTARCIFLSDSWTDSIPPDSLDPLLAELMQSHQVVVPPLKDRTDDIPALIQMRLRQVGLEKNQWPVLEPSALIHLRNHDWTGNEKELYAILNELVLFSEHNSGTDIDSKIDIEQLELAIKRMQAANSDLPVASRTEKAKIIESLWRHNFHRGRSAAALGISRKTLYNKIRRYDLDS